MPRPMNVIELKNLQERFEKEVRKSERVQVLEEIWEWLEIGIECKKPNPVIAQIANKIIDMQQEIK